MDWVNVAIIALIHLLVVMCVFTVSCTILSFLVGKFKSSDSFKSSRLFNPREYLPEEELSTLRQVFYLIMMLIVIINMIYLLVYWENEIYNFIFLDIFVSMYLAVHFRNSLNKIILFLLIPFGSLSFIIFGNSPLAYVDLIHIVAFLYFIRIYYRKFIDYTETNRLGVTILLLFSIVFISFFNTMIVENVTPINAIAMVSNAFTSNGYAILGESFLGKMNAILLVWSGFILSGVGTATLTVAIVLKSVNNNFDKLEDMIKRNKKR